MATEIKNYIFDNTVKPNAVTGYTLTRGVTDYTTLQQFDLFETGYSFLICLQIPEFMKVLAERNQDYKVLADNYRHIIEYEFRGAQGIEGITSETNALTNGINELNLITKVNEQAGSSFTMQYFERSGSILTKFNEAFLRGVKDPRTQVKRYLGLLNAENTSDVGSTAYAAASTQNALVGGKGFHQEIFHFLLLVTDNSALNIERAYILASCQPAQANTEIYNVTRGEISFQELSLQFNGFPISGRIVNEKGKQFLKWINANTCFDEMDYGYNILTDETKSDPARGNWVASPQYSLNNKFSMETRTPKN